MSEHNGAKLSQRLHACVQDIWPRYLTHPFVTQMADGTLPTEKFRYYMLQDYLYLKDYVKIFAAVRLAAKCRREGVIPAPSEDDWKLGSSVHRIDVEEKVLGYGKYPDDWYLPDMCYGSAVRSQYPRARVLAIDTSKAAALPGVVRVITAADIPGENKVGHLKHDQYSLIPIGGLTHYLGDAIALVVAETPEILEKAKKLVKVTYEPLPAVHNPPEAWAEGAPLVFDEEETYVQASWSAAASAARRT